LDKTLLHIIRCDRCEGDLVEGDGDLHCPYCGRMVPVEDGIPIFNPPPSGLQPSEKLVRGPDTGTPWRRANWRFLSEQVGTLPSEATILDVGAGRGDFANLFWGLDYMALDVYPYPEVDIVCDLTCSNPFREAVFDAVVLMNVLEHIYSTRLLLDSLVRVLKPGGVLIVAIPFLVKMHQEPVDFVRYTHYALERLGADYGLAVEHLEGYYDPISLLGEGTGNLKHALLPELRGVRHYTGRLILLGVEALVAALRRVVGQGRLLVPASTRSHAPTGYHVVYRKNRLTSRKGPGAKSLE
jgi:SAM-dependent methyltransferase